jgi:hypothetical protein
MNKTVSITIYKLLKAFLYVRHEIYLYDKTQVWSDKLGKVCVVHKLYKQWDLKEYKKIRPEYKPKKNQKQKKELVMDSFKQVDILLELVDRYKAGEMNGQEKTT